MLRAADMVVIVGTSLALTSGVMWTRSVAAGTDTAGHAIQAKVRVAHQAEGSAQRAVRVVHPGHVRRTVDAAGTAQPAGTKPQRWLDPYRIRTIVER